MRNIQGLPVRLVEAGSPAHLAGLRAGDRILSVNGVAVEDELDFMYEAAEPVVRIGFRRRHANRELELVRPENVPLGVSFVPAGVRRCNNRCVFCFVSQLPAGLRHTLYIKDEDYRHSFLHGNFVTLTTLENDDFERIEYMGLSPLYISVHATERAVRNHMLGNPNGPDVMAQLRRLARRGIRFHTQIVMCPGLNDGAVLRRTVRDLLGLRHGLLSIGIVPVGLTKYHRNGLRPVTPEDAEQVCAYADGVGEKHLTRYGTRMVYVADELLLRAGRRIPPARYYEGYPQLENGIGLLRLMLDEWRKVGRGLSGGTCGHKRRYLAAASVSAAPFVRRIADGLTKRIEGMTCEVLAIHNGFFGEQVTVAGLLTARDVIRVVRTRAPSGRTTLIVPAVMFNRAGHTLDGYSAKRLERAVGVPVIVVDSVSGLAEVVISGRAG